MRRTKIICTIGPASESEEVLKELMLAGMNVARFNFSHGTHEEKKKKLTSVLKVSNELGLPVATLLDTKGPEIRLKDFENGKAELLAGQTFILTTEEVMGTKKRASITYKNLRSDVKPGMTILIDDGKIEMTIEKINDMDIVCRVVNGGTVSNHKGINVPGAVLSMPYVSDVDYEDIRFCAQMGYDFLAASFARTKEDILQVRKILDENNSTAKIIAKIENMQGIENLDEILEVSDGIMVARGDLGVEIPAEEVPYLQKVLIQKCNDNFKPVITATQMLDSMIRNPRPTRAEVTDVANAVYDGTDAVMLSGETANGKYPVEALQMMVHIVESTEEHLDYETLLRQSEAHRMKSASSALGFATVSTAMNLKAKCIIAPSMSGATARVVSKFKPQTEIIGVSPDSASLRRMQIYWGVRPMKSIEVHTTEDICSSAIELVCAKQIAETGDVVILTAGIPSPVVGGRQAGVSNMMRIAIVD